MASTAVATGAAYAAPKLAITEPKPRRSSSERLGTNFVAAVNLLSDSISVTTSGSVNYPEEHEAIGFILHIGKRTGLSKKRALVYSRANRQLLIFSQTGELKAVMPLQKLKLLRKVTSGSNAPALELVWGSATYYVFVQGNEVDMNRWYTDLQRERVAAVGEEEDKVKDVPRYLKTKSYAAASATAESSKPDRRLSDPGPPSGGAKVKTALQNMFSWS